MEPPSPAPQLRTGKSGCLTALLWLLGLALAAGIIAWWVFAHDLATKGVAKKAVHFSSAQWKQVYDDAHAIYLRHAAELKTKNRVTLSNEEVPAAIKDLGYEEFFVTQEGVTYQRAGGGVEIFFTAIHCVFDPQSPAYDRKGIWFLGPQLRDWVYEEK